VPLLNADIPLGWLYVPFVAFVVVGTSNAVNLTDGLDGLAIGVTIIVATAFGGLAYVVGNVKFAQHLSLDYVAGAGELTVFCAALVGSGLGFLWYNAPPAEIFMGDVGSLMLGGAIGTVAVLTKTELLLVVIGGIFVLEAVSVMLQVTSFRLFGKRVFRMAPIHHHFELSGWKESKVVARFPSSPSSSRSRAFSLVGLNVFSGGKALVRDSRWDQDGIRRAVIAERHRGDGPVHRPGGRRREEFVSSPERASTRSASSSPRSSPTPIFMATGATRERASASPGRSTPVLPPARPGRGQGFDHDCLPDPAARELGLDHGRPLPRPPMASDLIFHDRPETRIWRLCRGRRR
jgi:hypothetical protein